MKTRTETRNVTTHGIGETTSFSIATNGKAFRSLIDSVYTDKITTPIRELMTNAFDSHRAAGKGDEPFTVFVPTNRDMRFAVRDYGTGMDHETVTHLYTTLFASSKEDTNDEVGQLGLGSKSPFAYTDTFTVTAFDGATKRVYTAFMASDLPQLALLHEGPSDELQGILVEFPVKSGDVTEFQRKAGHVAVGFDISPMIAGGSIDIIRPTNSGDGWRMFKSGYHSNSPFRGQEIYVRQGCVIYPVPGSSSLEFPLDYDSAVVIDVPIGTADVTLSREALSWDDETRKGVVEYVTKAWADACRLHQESYDALPRLIDKLRYRDANIPRNWWSHMNISAQSSVSLIGVLSGDDYKNALIAAVPGTVAWIANPTTRYGNTTKAIVSMDVEQTSKTSVVLMDDSTPRRVSRLRQWGRAAANYYQAPQRIYLPVEGQDVAKARLQEVWGLTDEQFIPVADLDDIDREVQAKINPTSKSVLQDLQEQLDNGALWVGTHSRRHEYLTLNNALTARSSWDTAVTKLELALPNIYEVLSDTEDIVFISRAQRELLTVNESNELSNRMADYIRGRVQSILDAQATNEAVNSVSQIVRYEARSAILGALGLSIEPIGTLEHEVLRGAGFLGINTNIHTDLAKDVVALTRKTFPLLFPLDGDEMVDYVKTQAATLNKENQQS